MTVSVETPTRMSVLKDRFAGRPAAVLGGGPSLPDDMARLPEGCLLIAVNYHASYLCQPDFMVYNDHPDDFPEMVEALKDDRVIRVSPEPTSHILFDVEVWTGFFSSNTAAWFACWMGCDPVILCGMDCYQGERIYFHEYQDKACFHNTPDHYIRPWEESAFAMLPHPERVRAMSGPLVGLFGAYHA